MNGFFNQRFGPHGPDISEQRFSIDDLGVRALPIFAPPDPFQIHGFDPLFLHHHGTGIGGFLKESIGGFQFLLDDLLLFPVDHDLLQFIF